MGLETLKKGDGAKSSLTPEQQKLVDANKNKAKTFFEAIEKGGGNVEVQEAKLNLKDLNEKLEMSKKSDPNDQETIKWYEKEIELNQRVINGEKLVDVLDSMKSEEDKKRIEEERKRIQNMKQL
jgi:hypothetical protein